MFLKAKDVINRAVTWFHCYYRLAPCLSHTCRGKLRARSRYSKYKRLTFVMSLLLLLGGLLRPVRVIFVSKHFLKNCRKETCLPASTLRCSSHRAARLPAVFLKLQEGKNCYQTLWKKNLTFAWSLCNPWKHSCQQWCFPAPPHPVLRCRHRPCVQLSVFQRRDAQAGILPADQAGHTPWSPPAAERIPFLWAVRAEVRRWNTPAGCWVDAFCQNVSSSLKMITLLPQPRADARSFNRFKYLCPTHAQ